jgi:uncharacterized protein (DUF1501 family)
MSHLHRRQVLKLMGSSSLAAALPTSVFAAEGARAAHTLVIVYQRGGMDGLSALVPFADSEYYLKRTTAAVPRPGSTGGALDLDGSFGLHPALAPLKTFWDRGQLAAVPATGLTTPSRSHFDAQDFMERAWLSQGQVFTGWLNRYLSAKAGAGQTFRAVALGTAVPRSLSGPEATIGLSSIASFDVQSRSARKTQSFDALEAQFTTSNLVETTATRAFGAIDELKALNAGALAVENGATYPNTDFGRRLTDIARLIKRDVGLEIATVDIGGWDTHDNQANRLQTLFTEFAGGLAAFATDLGAAFNRVTVITMTEFGRRVQQNASAGTDHGRASTMFALGGRVNGKRLYGEWPTLAPNRLEDGDLRVTTDYRSVLAEALVKQMGNPDLAQVFPGFTGTPLSGMFA